MKKPKPTPSSPLSAPDGFNITSVGNADRFLRDHGTDLLWIEGTGLNSAGSFFWWDSLRWVENNARAVELAQQTVRKLGDLVKKAVANNCSAAETEKLVKFWKSSEADYEAREVLCLAKPHIVIDRGKFDADPDLLGVKNGTLDLKDHSFRTPARADLITKQCSVQFDPEAKCPTWERFLSETTGGDVDLVRYLQQCVGLTLAGHQREHLFFVVVGPAATGKSTFHEALQFVLGDYACSIDPNSLAAASKSEGGRARPDIAKLAGMRFVLANESRAGLRLDEGLVKSLSGGDTFTARQLYEGEFDFKPSFKLWLRTNAEPQFDGADTGMQRRIRKIPFVNVVAASGRDRNLADKLRSEGSGILNWALAGLRDYQANGLVEPEVVKRETDEYIRSLDIIGQFITERCVLDKKASATATELYQEYKLWMPNQNYAVGTARFKSDLVGRGFIHQHTRRGSMWLGIRLAGVVDAVLNRETECVEA